MSFGGNGPADIIALFTLERQAYLTKKNLFFSCDFLSVWHTVCSDANTVPNQNKKIFCRYFFGIIFAVGPRRQNDDSQNDSLILRLKNLILRRVSKLDGGVLK